MSVKKKRWLIALGLLVAIGITALFVAASVLAKRFEPYIREQAILYLRERFDSEVELASLRVRLPKTSPLHLLLTRGRGSTAAIEGEGIVMRHKGRRDVAPMFSMSRFSFDVDLGTLFTTPKVVPLVTLDGIEINIPPKDQRPALDFGTSGKTEGQKNPAQSDVIINEVTIKNARLMILPKDKQRFPLRFDIHRLRLDSAGVDVAMKYTGDLAIPKPPGEIHSEGTFGPWSASEPGDTPLTGDYTFKKADLGVFSGIAGILHSNGQFEGSLDSISAKGSAVVPDFRLKMSGNRVRLSTTFEVLVDGTNGNTVLKPVRATLGNTNFTTSGGVIKHVGDQAHAVTLDVLMPKGNVQDLLRLAMKGPPIMEGQISLKTKIDIPPLTRDVREKLLLDGRFDVTEGRFLQSKIQDQIDGLSRRGQGEPKNDKIDEVVSRMTGVFKLKNEQLTFQTLSFGVTGAAVQLAGDYNLEADSIDFRGTLKLRAKVSQTMTGWKRWALKPADPFFSKNGAGTFLRIKVSGAASDPKFGLDRGSKDEATNAVKRNQAGPG